MVAINQRVKNNTNRGNPFELVGERFILKLYFSVVAL